MNTSTITRAQATTILTQRHADLSVRFPIGMAKVPLRLYLRRNVRGVMRLTPDGLAAFLASSENMDTRADERA